MLAFLLQSLLWLLLAFGLGYWLGWLLKGVFCKRTHTDTLASPTEGSTVKPVTDANLTLADTDHPERHPVPPGKFAPSLEDALAAEAKAREKHDHTSPPSFGVKGHDVDLINEPVESGADWLKNATRTAATASGAGLAVRAFSETSTSQTPPATSSLRAAIDLPSVASPDVELESVRPVAVNLPEQPVDAALEWPEEDRSGVNRYGASGPPSVAVTEPVGADWDYRVPNLTADGQLVPDGEVNLARRADAAVDGLEVNLPKVDLPEVDVNLPKVDMPDVDVNLPKVDLPEVDVNLAEVSAVEIDLPKVDLDLPKVDLSEVDVNLPTVDLPDVDVTLPEVSGVAIDLPKVDLDLPAVDLPDVDANLPTVDLNLPTVELPAVDVNLPEVSGVNVDLPKLEGGDIALGTTVVGALTAGVVGLVRNTEGTMEGINVDLPEAGVKLPAVDINLPRVDLGITEVDLLEVDISLPSVENVNLTPTALEWPEEERSGVNLYGASRPPSGEVIASNSTERNDLASDLRVNGPLVSDTDAQLETQEKDSLVERLGEWAGKVEASAVDAAKSVGVSVNHLVDATEEKVANATDATAAALGTAKTKAEQVLENVTEELQAAPVLEEVSVLGDASIGANLATAAEESDSNRGLALTMTPERGVPLDARVERWVADKQDESAVLDADLSSGQTLEERLHVAAKDTVDAVREGDTVAVSAQGDASIGANLAAAVEEPKSDRGLALTVTPVVEQPLDERLQQWPDEVGEQLVEKTDHLGDNVSLASWTDRTGEKVSEVVVDHEPGSRLETWIDRMGEKVADVVEKNESYLQVPGGMSEESHSTAALEPPKDTSVTSVHPAATEATAESTLDVGSVGDASIGANLATAVEESDPNRGLATTVTPERGVPLDVRVEHWAEGTPLPKPEDPADSLPADLAKGKDSAEDLARSAVDTSLGDASIGANLADVYTDPNVGLAATVTPEVGEPLNERLSHWADEAGEQIAKKADQVGGDVSLETRTDRLGEKVSATVADHEPSSGLESWIDRMGEKVANVVEKNESYLQVPGGMSEESHSTTALEPPKDTSVTSVHPAATEVTAESTLDVGSVGDASIGANLATAVEAADPNRGLAATVTPERGVPLDVRVEHWAEGTPLPEPKETAESMPADLGRSAADMSDTSLGDASIGANLADVYTDPSVGLAATVTPEVGEPLNERLSHWADEAGEQIAKKADQVGGDVSLETRTDRLGEKVSATVADHEPSSSLESWLDRMGEKVANAVERNEPYLEVPGGMASESQSTTSSDQTKHTVIDPVITANTMERQGSETAPETDVVIAAVVSSPVTQGTTDDWLRDRLNRIVEVARERTEALASASTILGVVGTGVGVAAATVVAPTPTATAAKADAQAVESESKAEDKASTAVQALASTEKALVVPDEHKALLVPETAEVDADTDEGDFTSLEFWVRKLLSSLSSGQRERRVVKLWDSASGPDCKLIAHDREEALLVLTPSTYDKLDGIHCGVTRPGFIAVGGDVAFLEVGEAAWFRLNKVLACRADHDEHYFIHLDLKS